MKNSVKEGVPVKLVDFESVKLLTYDDSSIFGAEIKNDKRSGRLPQVLVYNVEGPKIN